MTPVSWHPLARRELFDGSGFYEEAEQGLGEAFLSAVEQLVERIARHPLSAPKVFRKARGAPIRRFPYNVIYRIDEDGTIWILAVAHHKRRPRYWARRLRV